MFWMLYQESTCGDQSSTSCVTLSYYGSYNGSGKIPVTILGNGLFACLILFEEELRHVQLVRI
jgi:hypothetical protein